MQFRNIDEVRAVLGENLPVRMDRNQATAFIMAHFFRVSKRAYETWPVKQQIIDCRSHSLTVDIANEAQRRLDVAPVHINPNAKSSGQAPNSDISSNNSNARRTA
jgi:hypothetical protein